MWIRKCVKKIKNLSKEFSKLTKTFIQIVNNDRKKSLTKRQKRI